MMTTLMMILYLILRLFLSHSILQVPLVGNDQDTGHFPAVKNHLHLAAVTNEQTSPIFHVKVGDSMKDLTLVIRDHGS